MNHKSHSQEIYNQSTYTQTCTTPPEWVLDYTPQQIEAEEQEYLEEYATSTPTN